MPEKKKHRKTVETKDIRSMRDAVDDIVSFDVTEDGDENMIDIEETDVDKSSESPRPSRKLRSMSEAVEEVRTFADDVKASGRKKHHAASEVHKKRKIYGDAPAEEDEHRHKKRRRKKQSFIETLLHPEKKIRRSADQPFTIWGHRLSFWPVFLVFIAVLMVLVFLLNSANLTVDQQSVTLMALSPDAEGYRILVLSDLNGKRFGDKQSTLLRELDSIKYDIVVCLGDMVGEDGDPEPFYELLEGLPSNRKVYFICGDSDPGPFAPSLREESGTLSQRVLADWILGAIDRGAIYVDSPKSISLGSVDLWLTPADMLNINASDSVNLWKEQTAQEESGYLAGIAADKHTLPFTNYRYLLAQEHLAAVTDMSDSDIHIALSHIPPTDSFITSACNQSVLDGKFLAAPDIVLSGHYCGGVWNLPVLGAFYVPDSSLERYGWFPARDRVSGLREVDDAQIYTTRGLSTSGDTPLMPFRLLNSPEISVITITATSPQSMLE